MSDSFSKRHGYETPKPISDEAPKWLREALYSRAIGPLLRNEPAPHTPNMAYLSILQTSVQEAKFPIRAAALAAHIALANQRDLPPGLDSVYAKTSLERLLYEIPWPSFYDAIELIGRTLIDIDADRQTNFLPVYLNTVNHCFAVANIQWLLNPESSLGRVRPNDVTALEDEVAALAPVPTSRHLEKAKSFLNSRPPDSANAIKECISALESYSRTLDPSATTLGHAVKTFKGKGMAPPILLSSIEKLYGFANSEAGVRHGAPTPEKVTNIDAEFVYATAMAMIRYLHAVSEV